MDQVEDTENGTENEGVEEPVAVTSWEFTDAPPSTETVVSKLTGLANRWGLHFEEYVEYVQPLGQNKKMPKPAGASRREPDQYKQVYTLYFTVAGRIAMLNDLADVNDWRVDFVPEPVTPTGIPGYIVKDDAYIVYREYVEIWGLKKDGREVLLGRKPGTASVPATGGSGAVGSNRFEKVETSARGRALGAWGIGVLPGSGVASYEEMQAAQRTQNSQEFKERQSQAPGISRDQIVERLRMCVADYQEVSDQPWEQVITEITTYAKTTFDKVIGKGADGKMDFTPLKDGELTIMTRAIGKKAAGIRIQKESIA